MNAGRIDGGEAPMEILEGPGQRLRQARLAQGMDIGRIANQLRLKPDAVEALERDDYGFLPEPVFVKGYITNYARLVEAPVDPLLAAYARLQSPIGRAVEPTPKPAPMPKRVGGGSHWLFALAGVLLLSLLAAGGYWASLRTEPETVAAGSEDEAAVALPAVEEELPPSLKELLEDGQRAIPPEPEPEQSESTEAPAIEPEPTSEPTENADPGLDPVIDSAPSEPALLAATVPTEAESEPAAEPADPPEVVLELLGSCWVDIRDANGNNKIIGELSKGDRRSLQGRPPFSVVLGNSRVVRIMIGGEPYDIARHARGNVARFKLDPSVAQGGG